jgi:hypothetical protein
MSRPLIASVAKQLLFQASQRLGTADPNPDVRGYLDESLGIPVGEPAAERSRLLEPSFSETAPDNLAFTVSGHPHLSPADRVALSTHAMSNIVGTRFGNGAERWLDQHTELARSNASNRSATWGASFSGAFDRNGVSEAAVHYEWGPLLMDSLPAPLYRVARAALEMIPGVRPALSSIRCGRTSGSQQITFEIERPLPLANLQPLMERLGLGEQHASLMSSVAFILGARFTLPPETAMLTLRPVRHGVELRLDVDLDALPDPPAQLMALTRLQMTERPRSLQALDRWMIALTPDGYPGPGSVSVLSVWVRPDMPARVALYLNPAALHAPPATSPAREIGPAPIPARASQPAAAEASWAASAWAP